MDPGLLSPLKGHRPALHPLHNRFAQDGSLPPRKTGEGCRVTSTGSPTLLHTRLPPSTPRRPPSPPSVVVGTRPASVTPADCSLPPCPGRACLAVSPAGTCWVPSQQQQQQHTIPYHTIPYHTIPYHTIPYHTIPYHTIPYHTIPYHTIPYHTIPYHTIPYSGVPPGDSEVLPRRGPRAQGTPPGFYGHAGRSSHRRPPPPAWVGAHNNRQPPHPSAPRKRDSGAEGWVYSPMPRGHELTWRYTGRYTPAPHPCSRGAPVVPRAGSTPFSKERPPSRALAQPLGASQDSAPSQHSPPAPPPPAAAPGPAWSPPRRPTHYRDPGLGAPVPSPARTPGVPPAGPVPVRFGRQGTARRSPRLHQDSPPWMELGGIRPC